jgi:hypothetical protein
MWILVSFIIYFEKWREKLKCWKSNLILGVEWHIIIKLKWTKEIKLRVTMIWHSNLNQDKILTCVREFSVLIYMVKFLQIPFKRVGYFLNTKVPFLCLMWLWTLGIGFFFWFSKIDSVCLYICVYMERLNYIGESSIKI